MPITTNTSGVLHELTDVTVNEGGILHALDTVHANEGGVLYEIHSSWKPPQLSWSVDSSKDTVTKINSVRAYLKSRNLHKREKRSIIKETEGGKKWEQRDMK